MLHNYFTTDYQKEGVKLLTDKVRNISISQPSEAVFYIPTILSLEDFTR